MSATNYDILKLDNGSKIIARQEGLVSLEDIITKIEKVVEYAKKSGESLSFLSDISKVDLDEVSFDKIPQIFKPFKDNVQAMPIVKIAVYNGNNRIEDYLKSSAFSKHENLTSIWIKSFIKLDDAMEWLEFSKSEQKAANEFLG